MNTHTIAKETALAKDINRYNFLYSHLDAQRYSLLDTDLGRSIVIDLDKCSTVVNETTSLAGTIDFHTNLMMDNDYEYTHEVGFYLDNYVELAIPKGSKVSFKNKMIKLLDFVPRHEISKPTNLYSFISNKEPAGRNNNNELTLKLHGVDMEHFLRCKEACS